MHIEGCESVRVSVVKLVKTMYGDGDDELDKLVRRIQTESLATPRPRDYDLHNLQYTKLIESTSPTLLRLVSGGRITKQALAQCVEQHISGITALYDEVLRFRKSAANFVSNSQQEYHKMLGLTTDLGPFFSWADNDNLFIASPTGTKTPLTPWSVSSHSTRATSLCHKTTSE